MKSFCALAFLKTDEVISAFEQLADNDNVPSAFISYFECTYIGIVRGRGGRQRRDLPMFPIALWNVRSRLENNLPKSNNSVEGFHNALRSSITSTHPNIWKLMFALKQELELSEMKTIQRLRGDFKSKKNKYQIMDMKIKNQLSQFNKENDDHYQDLLMNLANVITF